MSIYCANHPRNHKIGFIRLDYILHSTWTNNEGSLFNDYIRFKSAHNTCTSYKSGVPEKIFHFMYPDNPRLDQNDAI